MLERPAEHEQGEHVEEDVRDVEAAEKPPGVQKAVGDDLPGLEVRTVGRPEREQIDECRRRHLLQKEYRDIGNDEGPCDGRQEREHRRSLPGADPALQENEVEPTVELVPDLPEVGGLLEPETLMEAD